MTLTAAPAATRRPRIAFLGLGWIGRNRMEAVAAADIAEIVAISDPSPEAMDEAARVAPDAARGGGLDGLLATKPDGVVIATPSRASRRTDHRRAGCRRRRVLPEAAGPHRARSAGLHRSRPRRQPASVRRPELPPRRRLPRPARSSRGRRTGAGPRARPDVPQRLRPRKTVVPRPDPVGRGLPDRPRVASSRHGGVGAGRA